MKRGQMTIFVVIAVLIISSIALLVYTNKSKKDSGLNKEISSNLDPELQKTESYIIECADKTTKEALDKIGLQGGYYKKPEKYFDLEYAFVPYYYYEGKFLMPSKEIVQNEMDNYVDENLDDCIKSQDFEGVQITYKKSQTKSSIKPSEVIFEIDMPITLAQDTKRAVLELKNYPVIQNSSLYDILETAKYMTDSHKRDPKFYCISCVGEMASEKKLYINLLNIDNNSILTIISENHTSTEPYSFAFLDKYTGDEKSSSPELGNLAPPVPVEE